MTLGHDASFAHQSFIELCNADLSNNLGNLLSRVVGLCQKNTQGCIPAFLEEEAIDHEIRDLCLKLPEQLALDMKAWQPNRYVEHIMECANAINKYLQETKPWTLAKDETKKARTQTILRTALEGIRLCFAWLSPVMPKRTKEILDSLHVSLSLSESRQWAVLKDGAKLPEKMMGFPRIED